MTRHSLLCLALFAASTVPAQWEAGGILSITSHYSACAFHQVDTGLFVYGSNNPGPSPSATEGGILRTTDGASGGGGYIWYEPSTFLEDIDVKMAGGKPWYIAVGHELYNYSLAVRKTPGSPNQLQFDSVRTGSGRYYRAVRMRNDLVAFAAGGNAAGDGIIDMSTDTGSTWTNVAVLPGQPVSRLHFVNDLIGFATTGGYARLLNNGVSLPASGAIYRTTDGGFNWAAVHVSNVTGFSDVEFRNAQVGVATRNDGAILRTTDGGDTWEPASVTLSGSYVLTSVVFRADGLGFASAYRTDGTEGIILSSNDAGANWAFNYSTAGMNGARRIYDLYFFDNAHGYACAHWKPLVTDGLVTGMGEERAVSLQLFPNPATDVVTLQAQDAFHGWVDVLDATGRTVQQGRMNGIRMDLSVNELPTGAYTIRVGNERAVHTLRFVRP
ncbi:MAG: T9SS type A sorting domain-containing protein [Flavobacteriales bacterium]|nr:T9SS type A sorting domain-containing protein [Flavobacteriales bacterium]